MKPATSKTELPTLSRLRKAFFRRLSLYCLFAYMIQSLTVPIQADIVYVPAEGRVSVLDTQTGRRSVASGWNLPASGFVAIDPVTGDYYTADQADRAVYRVNRTNGVVSLVSGIGVGNGPAFTAAVYGIAVETNGSPVVVDGIGGLLAVIRINPQTGNRTVLSAGANSSVPAGGGLSFQSPFGIAIEGAGDLLVTDINRNAVIRVNRVTGNRSLVSGDPFGDNAGSGPDMNRPEGIAIRTDGAIFVSDSGGTSSAQRIIQINPTNGNRSVVSAGLGTLGATIYGLSLGTNGAVIAPYQQTINSHPVGGAILGVDPVTGSATTVTRTGDGFNSAVGTGPTLLNPVGVIRGSNGLIVVSDVLVRSIFVVDPITGNRSILTNSRTGNGTELFAAKGIAMGTNGVIVVADDGDSSVTPTNVFVVNRWPVLVQADPNTGNRSILSAGSNTGIQRGSGSNFDSPKGVAREISGAFVVADSGSSNPKVVRIDPLSGNRTILSSSSLGSGTNLVAPYGIVVENSGSLIVTDTGLNSVIRIDPATGNRMVLSGASQGTGTTFLSIKSVTLLGDGALAVADASRVAIFRVDPISGNRTIVSDASHGTGPNFASPCGVAIEATGKLLVVNSSSDSLYRVDPVTGNRTIVAGLTAGAGPLIQTAPEFLAVAPPLALTTPARQGNGNIQFNLLSPVGRQCFVEASTNLTVWSVLTNFASTSATNLVIDAGTASLNARFYRARLSP